MTASPEPAGALTSTRVPDFFIVGHHKSGTTALYEMLRRHPQIYMPAVKEPRFFASDLRPLAAPSYSHTLEAYLSLFAPAGDDQRTGEATPLYLLSETAAGAIAAAAPAAKIIAIFREPASFLRSLHLQFVQAHVETETDLRRALALQDARRRGESMPKGLRRPQLLMYSDHVRYVEQLRRFEAVFAPEQLLTLIYDDFRADNEAAVRRVLRFLDVDDTAPIEVVEANPTVAVRSVRLNHLVRGVYVGRGRLGAAVNAGVKALVPRSARRRALQAVHRRVVYRAPQSPDEQLALELRRSFTPEVVALGEHLDRDLVSLWGYDRLD
jgi:Sulfotransferase domain